ncbi:hypothetical protein UA18_01346 [Burkholderia multivorans]|uniref:Bacteriophage protein n=1 Tax=Burkholderia multivorans TaxID=87883 RepID=A0ABD7LHT8_9BURK|nr:hypothetical protein UA18_01346 [Burkholderia multivorans]SAK18087.1 hypothetical protein UA17_01542 [Burkholderia multivorans]
MRVQGFVVKYKGAVVLVLVAELIQGYVELTAAYAGKKIWLQEGAGDSMGQVGGDFLEFL